MHFTNIWHIQQGQMSAATCEEVGEKRPNVRMS